MTCKTERKKGQSGPCKVETSPFLDRSDRANNGSLNLTDQMLSFIVYLNINAAINGWRLRFLPVLCVYKYRYIQDRQRIGLQQRRGLDAIGQYRERTVWKLRAVFFSVGAKRSASNFKQSERKLSVVVSFKFPAGGGITCGDRVSCGRGKMGKVLPIIV